MRFLFTLLPFLLVSAPAHADPVTAVITAVSGFFGAVGSTAIGSFLLRTAASFALSALSGALMGKPKQAKPGIATESTMTGATNPQTIIFGEYATAGTLVCPPMTHGHRGKKSMDYLTYVIDLADYPIEALKNVYIGEEECSFLIDDGLYGKEVNSDEYRGRAWLRWHDGRQSEADPMLVQVYGKYERPWTPQHVLKGVAYAVLTFKHDEKKTDGMPEVLFTLAGARLYDPRNDSTVGGSGTQRFFDPSTHRYSGNPVVMIYNLMRGLRLADGAVYGLRVPAEELPLDRWVAAMNVCDEQEELRINGESSFEPKYRAGLEFSVDQEPLDVIQTLLTACSGQIADCGGAWNITVGPAGFPRAHFTDADIITTSDQDFEPFRGLADTYNGAHASYPSPYVKWKPKDAPPFYNREWEEEDDGRRLTATLNLNAVISGYQAQRLMREMVSDNRRWTSHTLTLRPGALGLLPLDTVTWTSARNGYDRKLFEIARKTVDPQTLCVTLQLRVRTPADYEYDYEELEPIVNPSGPWKKEDGATPPGEGGSPPDGSYDGLVPTRPDPVKAHLVAVHDRAVSESRDGGYSWTRAAAPFVGGAEISALRDSYVVRTGSGEVWFATKNAPNAWRRLDIEDLAAVELLNNGDFEQDLVYWQPEFGEQVISESTTPPQQGGEQYLRFDGAGQLRQDVMVPQSGTLTVAGDVWVAEGTATIGVGRMEPLIDVALNPGTVVWHHSPTYIGLPGGLRLKLTMTDRGNGDLSNTSFFRKGGVYAHWWRVRVSLVDAADAVQNLPLEIDFTNLEETQERIQIFGATGVVQDANIDRVNLGDGGVQLTGTGTGGAGNFTVSGVGFVDFRPEQLYITTYGVDIDAIRLRVYGLQVVGSLGSVSSGSTPGWRRISTQLPVQQGPLIFFAEATAGPTYMDNLSLKLGVQDGAKILKLATDTAAGGRAHYAVSSAALYRIGQDGGVEAVGAEGGGMPIQPPFPAVAMAAHNREVVVADGVGVFQLSTDFMYAVATDGVQVFARPGLAVDSSGLVVGVPGAQLLEDLGGDAWLERDYWRGKWVSVRQSNGAVLRGGFGAMAAAPSVPMGGLFSPRILAVNTGRWVCWRPGKRDILWLDGGDDAWGLSVPLGQPINDLKEVR